MGDRMNPTARLGLHVATSLTRTRAASDIKVRVREKLVAGVKARETRRSGRTRRGIVAVVMASAAALLLASYFAWPKKTLSFTVEGEKSPGVVGAFLSSSTTGELPLAFSDGTRVVLGKAARARIAHVDDRGARVLLESGELHANVVHRKDTRWLVEAGPFEVRVTGTQFDVRWDAASQAVVVRLIEGSVIVTGCALGEGRRVSAGEQLSASCKESTSPPPSSQASAPVSADPITPVVAVEALAAAHSEETRPALGPAAAPPVATAEPTTNVPRAPKSLVRDAVDASTVEAAAPLTKEPDSAELLLRADDDRFARRFDDAESALLEIRKRFAGTDAAAKAAFELGRITFDARGNYGQAATWFDTYLRERPAGNLAREALGRGLEARLRGGDTETATNLATRYLAAYPDGPHAKLARKTLEGR